MSQERRPIVFFALAATLLLRATIPAGFMPAAPGAGFPLQICPSGLPEGALQRLTGATPGHPGGGQASHGGHHGNHDKHGHRDQHDQHAGDDGHHGYSAEQCPIGHLLAAAALPVHTEPSPPRLLAPGPAGQPQHSPPAARIALYRSRGPPLPSAA